MKVQKSKFRILLRRHPDTEHELPEQKRSWNSVQIEQRGQPSSVPEVEEDRRELHSRTGVMLLGAAKGSRGKSRSARKPPRPPLLPLPLQGGWPAQRRYAYDSTGVSGRQRPPWDRVPAFPPPRLLLLHLSRHVLLEEVAEGVTVDDVLTLETRMTSQWPGCSHVTDRDRRSLQSGHLRQRRQPLPSCTGGLLFPKAVVMAQFVDRESLELRERTTMDETCDTLDD